MLRRCIWLVWALLLTSFTLPSCAAPLRVENGRFVDQAGGDVVLRGFNLSQWHKFPPFRPNQDPALFVKLKALGANVVRVQFNWEAFELSPGVYDESYLDYYEGVVNRAAAQHVFVLVDVHQDAFSRWTLRGCGEGFPRWAIPAGVYQFEPSSGSNCQYWFLQSMLHGFELQQLFDRFLQPGNMARERYLLMLERLAQRFAGHPSVVGYELMNEPFGDDQLLMGLYRDGAAHIRAIDPQAVLFLSPQAITGLGLVQTHMPPPGISNIVFAPHYYNQVSMQTGNFGAGVRYEPVGASNRALAKSWGAAVFLGEFGANLFDQVAAYMDMVHNDLDVYGESGTQWGYTPEWNEIKKDGWNLEDLSVVDDKGQLRANFRLRPYVQRTAGPYGQLLAIQLIPGWLGGDPYIAYRWRHDPTRGSTDVFVPAALYRHHAPRIAVSSAAAHCQWLPKEQLVRCESPNAGDLLLSVN